MFYNSKLNLLVKEIENNRFFFLHSKGVSVPITLGLF